MSRNDEGRVSRPASVRGTSEGPHSLRRLQRRTPIVPAVTTAIGSAGLAARRTAGALLGTRIAGTETAAVLPLGLLVVGQPVAALLVSGTTRPLSEAPRDLSGGQ